MFSKGTRPHQSVRVGTLNFVSFVMSRLMLHNVFHACVVLLPSFLVPGLRV